MFLYYRWGFCVVGLLCGWMKVSSTWTCIFRESPPLHSLLPSDDLVQLNQSIKQGVERPGSIESSHLSYMSLLIEFCLSKTFQGPLSDYRPIGWSIEGHSFLCVFSFTDFDGRLPLFHLPNVFVFVPLRLPFGHVQFQWNNVTIVPSHYNHHQSDH